MFSYRPDMPISSVTIFGLGGTGARVASTVCQQLMSQEYTKNVKVIFVDGDKVESKNCIRQLFVESDVGKFKSDVIASRLTRAFGSNIVSVPEFFPDHKAVAKVLSTSGNYTKYGDISVLRHASSLEDAPEGHLDYVQKSQLPIINLLRAYRCKNAEELEQEKLMFEVQDMNKELKWSPLGEVFSKGLNVVILAVDSIPARQSIISFYQYLALCGATDLEATDSEIQGSGYHSNLLRNFVFIDGGNEDTFGQANIFGLARYSLSPNNLEEFPERSPFCFPLSVMPFPHGRYKNMKPGNATRRCGDIDQTLAINTLVATNMLLFFQNLHFNNEIKVHTIRFNLSGDYFPEKMTFKWMKGVLTDNSSYTAGVVRSDVINAIRSGTGYTFSELSPEECVAYSVHGTHMVRGRSYGLPKCIPDPQIRLYKRHVVGVNRSILSLSNKSTLNDEGEFYTVFTALMNESWDGIMLYTQALDISWSEIALPIFDYLKSKFNVSVNVAKLLSSQIVLPNGQSVRVQGSNFTPTFEAVFCIAAYNSDDILRSIGSGYESSANFDGSLFYSVTNKYFNLINLSVRVGMSCLNYIKYSPYLEDNILGEDTTEEVPTLGLNKVIVSENCHNSTDGMLKSKVKSGKTQVTYYSIGLSALNDLAMKEKVDLFLSKETEMFLYLSKGDGSQVDNMRRIIQQVVTSDFDLDSDPFGGQYEDDEKFEEGYPPLSREMLDALALFIPACITEESYSFSLVLPILGNLQYYYRGDVLFNPLLPKYNCKLFTNSGRRLKNGEEEARLAEYQYHPSIIRGAYLKLLKGIRDGLDSTDQPLSCDLERLFCLSVDKLYVLRHVFNTVRGSMSEEGVYLSCIINTIEEGIDKEYCISRCKLVDSSFNQLNVSSFKQYITGLIEFLGHEDMAWDNFRSNLKEVVEEPGVGIEEGTLIAVDTSVPYTTIDTSVGVLTRGTT